MADPTPATNAQIPTDSLSNALHPCFYTVRQLLPTKLSSLANTHLPPQHPCIEYMASVQKILHHLLEIRGLIAAFILAGNNYNPTHTSLDRHWHHVEKYEKVWAGVEGVLQACLDGAFGGLGGQQSRGADFIIHEGEKCAGGNDFFKRFCTRDTDDYFNEIEEYCEEVEQECVISRTNSGWRMREGYWFFFPFLLFSLNYAELSQ